jgi:cytochrome P450
MRDFQRFLVAPPRVPAFIRDAMQSRVERARADLDALVADLCRTRRRQRVDPPDLVQLLLDATDPDAGDGTAARLEEREVRDEIVTFLLAGHETTSNALAWAFYLISRDPEVEARLRAELRDVLGTRAPEASDLDRLVYTKAILEETMRLYPPAFSVPRRAAIDTQIDRWVVPKGSEVIVWIYFTHRDPSVFPDPERFDPSRFLEGRDASIPKCGYLPFGAGPRACIGKTFAMAEAMIAIATIAQRARFEYTGRKAPTPRGRITLTPGGGVPVRVLRP